MHTLRTALAALALALVALIPVAVRAQSPEQRVDLLLGDAYADYDMLQLDAAEEKLIEAIQIAADNGVRSPGTAAAYIMLGVVWAAQTGDVNDARQPFVDGLSVDPVAEIHPYYATPSLVALLEEVRAETPAAPAAGGWEDPGTWEDPGNWGEPEPTPVAPPVVTAPPVAPPVVTSPPVAPPVVTTPPVPAGPVLTHTPVAEADAGRPIPLSARAGSGVPVARVSVNYRPFGTSSYFSADLTASNDGATFRGEIPAGSTRNAVSIDYFIVAYDMAGTSLGAVGSAAQPYTLFLRGVDGPSASRNSRDRDRDRNTGDGEIAHLSLHGGTGLGLATGDPNVYYDDVELNPGLAPTPFHIGAELGIAPGRGSFHIVPFLRLQMVLLDTGMEPLPLFGVKARLFFKDGGALRIYGQGGIGYGEVSHLVRLDQVEEGTFDTTNEGPFHIGGGLGMAYMFSQHIGVQADAYVMFLLPQVSVQLDVAAGPYIAF